jgi:hypothetical protein
MKTIKKSFFILVALTIYPYIMLAQSPYDFVTMKGNKFQLGGKDFYPLTLNYRVGVMHDGNGNYWVTPHHHYGPNWGFSCNNEVDCYESLVDDFTAIKNSGFNSIRIVEGLEFGYVNDESSFPAILARDQNVQNTIVVPISSPYTAIFNMIEKVLDAAEEADLKVKLLVGGKRIDESSNQSAYLAYLAAISDYFSENTTLYSYDFYNEPAYNWETGPLFDKYAICNMVNNWNNAIKSNSNHLTTIGLANSTETIIGYDVGMLRLDYISFHPYDERIYPEPGAGSNTSLNDAIDRVKSEIKWFSKHCPLPWTIGETGFRAPKPSYHNLLIFGNKSHHMQGDYADLSHYAKETLEYSRDCGASGYSWWEFHDRISSDLSGYTYNGCNCITDMYGIFDDDGNPKPVISEFVNFDPFDVGSNNATPSLYYNYYGYSNHFYWGTVNDQNSNPIEGAVVQGRSSTHLAKTFTYSNGQYMLFTDVPITKLRISGVRTQSVIDQNVSSPLSVSLDKIHVESSLFLNNLWLSNTQYYKSEGFISSTNTVITPSGSVIMRAKNTIELYEGFHAESGSYFHAYNAPIYPSCSSISNNLLVYNDIPNTGSINEGLKSQAGRISVFPNPTDGIINIESLHQIGVGEIQITNNIGQIIFTQDISNSNHEIVDLSKLSGGVYYIFIDDGSDEIFIKKIIIQ